MLKLDQVITFKGKDEMANAIVWLEEHGYENVSHLTIENYKLLALVIRGDCFFGTNVTCLAASGSKGNKTINWKKWLERINQEE